MKSLLQLATLILSPSAFAAVFTLPVLPDTQNEVTGNVTMFTDQMNWIVSNHTTMHMPTVLAVGDIVNWDTADHAQWVTASNGYTTLDNAAITYTVCVGNHDTAAVTVGGGAAPGNVNANLRNTTSFNTYFPVNRFVTQQGRWEANKSDNVWSIFTAGGVNWLVLSLELWPRQGAIDWANTVVVAHPNHNVIVVTHSYLNSDGTIKQDNGGYGDTSPQHLFDTLVKVHPNVLLVLCGHVDSSAWRTDTGTNGNKVYSILQDYQTTDLGGGFIRLFDIDTTAHTIAARMYSPYHNTTKTDSSMFTISNVTFIQPAPFETESLAMTASSGDTHRILTESGLSGGEGTILDATAVGDYVTYAIPAVAAGKYDVRVGVKKHNTRGIWQLSIGRADNFAGTANPLGTTQDEYSSADSYTEFDLGMWSPSTYSDKWFQFKVTGKNAASSGYSMAFDYIKLIPQ